MAVTFKEHLLSLNNFSMPKVLDNTDAQYVLIVRLLLLEPGTFQSHPNMGIGLRSRYRFRNDDDLLASLGNDIKNQLTKYLPLLQVNEVKLTIVKNTLNIIIDTADGAYVLAYDEQNNTLDTAPSYILADL